MLDGFDREISYLRLSVTDKCNLRCRYCMPKEGMSPLLHDEVLTLEEYLRLIRIFTGLGIKKVRITGGEPLLRKNLIWLIERLNELKGIEELALTTNGILLEKYADALKGAGVNNINLSLDTLKNDVFKKLTGFDGLPCVLAGLEKALLLGFKLKINCVPIKGINDEEIKDIALLSRKYPIDVRFIELMPIGCGREFKGIPTKEVISTLGVEDCFKINKNVHESGASDGPAVYVSPEGFNGRIGFISPLSHKFCDKCNRIRLTQDGFLKTCLQYDTGIMLRKALREDKSDSELKALIIKAIENKPKEHGFLNETENVYGEREIKKMSQIGG